MDKKQNVREKTPVVLLLYDDRWLWLAFRALKVLIVSRLKCVRQCTVTAVCSLVADLSCMLRDITSRRHHRDELM